MSTAHYKTRNWRDRLPANIDELTELRARARAAVETGELPERRLSGFVHWAWTEMLGEELVSDNSSQTLAIYRSVLVDLTERKPLTPTPVGGGRARRVRGDGGSVVALARRKHGVRAGSQVALTLGPVILEQRGLRQPDRLAA